MIRRASIALAALAVIGPAATIHAQGADTARYAVAYVEVTPASVAPATKALRTYRDAAARETGFVATEFFEQIGRPGHLVVYETWRDQAAFDAHQAAPSLAALKDALQ